MRVRAWVAGRELGCAAGGSEGEGGGEGDGCRSARTPATCGFWLLQARMHVWRGVCGDYTMLACGMSPYPDNRGLPPACTIAKAALR